MAKRVRVRDREEYAEATRAAKAARAAAAQEVAERIAEQVAAQLVESDVMGGRTVVARRISDVVTAEQRGDRVAERAAWMELSIAAAACVASLDFSERGLGPGEGRVTSDA